MLPGTDPPAPTWLEIDLAALRYNVRSLLRLVQPGAGLIAVVKADGYGHGAVEVSRAAVEAGAGGLAVARVAEGLELRRAGIPQPILVLGPFVASELRQAIEARLQLSVWNLDALRAVSSAAAAMQLHADFHLKVDTGMHRYGAVPASAPDILAAARSLPGVAAAGVYTHFATADEPEHPAFEAQLGTFRRCLLDIERAGLRPPVVHASNSAAAARGEAFDAIRPGIALYGGQPAASQRLDVKPVMTVKASVAHALDVSAGEGVSYGHVYVAARSHRALVLPCGYADGYMRALGGRGQALVGGERCRVLGRVTMDSIVVEAPGAGAAVGDEAVLLGTQGSETVSAEELAAHAGTISYEVLTGMGHRSPRRYLG